MKKKLMFSMLITLVFSLIIVITLFIVIVNYQYIEITKNNLRNNNNTVITLLLNQENSNREVFLSQNFNNSQIRITYIDKKGIVLYDSNVESDLLDNHNKREEIVEARRNGEGYGVRYSNSTKSDNLYYATVFDDGYIIRSAVSMKTVTGFEGKYIKYYFIVMVIAITMSFLFSSRLSYVIVKPIKDLQFITSRIAKGELDRRVNIFPNDEIGELGKTFNNMADKLQETLKDALDKQTRLEAILKSMESGVIAVDKSYKVIMINPYAKKIFGINKDIIGENLLDNIRDFELENVFKNKIEDPREIKILWPKQRELRIKTADIIYENDHIGTVAVVQDITDIKKLENIRSQFVANVSHELKTPLTSIKGFAETLRYVNDEATKEKFIGIINDEAERLTRLINDILTLSDLESSREYKTEEIDVNSTIKDVVYLMQSVADKKKIDILLVSDKTLKIIGDRDKFKQMLINLIDNAIKYSEEGARVTVGNKEEGNNCIIWVHDTGVGIPKEHIERLFERFYRVDKARSRSQGGTGLGLAIVKHIVMSFEGKISVESTLGEGSKFIVELPLRIKK